MIVVSIHVRLWSEAMHVTWTSGRPRNFIHRRGCICYTVEYIPTHNCIWLSTQYSGWHSSASVLFSSSSTRFTRFPKSFIHNQGCHIMSSSTCTNGFNKLLYALRWMIIIEFRCKYFIHLQKDMNDPHYWFRIHDFGKGEHAHFEYK